MKDYSVLLTCGESTMLIIHDAFDKGYQQGYADGKADTPFTDTEEAEKTAYERGLNEAWEAAKWLYNTQVDFVEDMFNCEYWEIYSRFTAQKVVHKIKEYEGKQKQDIIQVGDEVVIDDSIGIVTRAFPGAVTCYVMRKDGSSGEEDRNDCKTTGRHFDAIAEVLAEMRGESE